MAEALARAGADVVITSRTIASLDDTRARIESIGRKAIPMELNVRDEKSIRRMHDRAIETCDNIDILVNNAGCNIRKPAIEFAWDEWDTVVDTNLKGMFFVSTVFAPGMIKRGWGRVVNIGSVTSVFGFAGISPYCASRGGVKQLTMSLADEWGVHGINVNCLAPGWFRTEQNKILYDDPEWLSYITDKIPLKRPGQPTDLDGTVVFLASDASEYITGQTILVDGGITTGATRATTKK